MSDSLMEEEKKKEEEAKNNYEAFAKLLPQLLQTNLGQFALMKNKELIGLFPSATEAMREGMTKFEDKIFSIQEIRQDNNVQIGCFGV